MKYHKKDVTYYYLIITFIILNYGAAVYLISVLTQLSKPVYIVLTIVPSVILFMVLRYKTYSSLLWNMRRCSLSSMDEQHIINRYAHFDSSAIRSKMEVRVVADVGYYAWYIATPGTFYLTFSSSLIRDFHEIDMDGILAYLSVIRSDSLPLSESLILLLATMAQRAIITTPIAAALIHMVRSYVPDFIFDERAASKTKYTMGYKKMLTKLQKTSELLSTVPRCLGIQCVQDIYTQDGFFGRWNQVHETIGNRIQSIEKS